MSQQKTYPIHCPKCRHEQAVPLYESINVKTSPELKTLLMANQINVVECSQCHASFRVEKPLLYHDPVRRLMIYLIPMSEDMLEEGERQFAESLTRLTGILPEGVNAPDVCLVFSRTEMVERIFLFDADLNERIIEYIKYLIYSKNLGKLDPRRKALLFNVQDSTPEALCFVVQDIKTRKLESVIHYERATYDALCTMFDRDDQTANLLELFPGPYISARVLMLRDLQSGSKAGGKPRALPPEPPESP
ncbi:MAG TPA: CpXC domain-containing protein [Kiritimatiellia bacterium]|nr:CpXC domain-containing protein [Kiritimatiellia bacterium]